MCKRNFILCLAVFTLGIISCNSRQADIPLPEHPRPDFERSGFINLNGSWNFTFSEELAAQGVEAYDEKIQVPFPWGSALSGVEDKGDVAWYGREITVPRSWEGKRVFLVIGASDWETTAWIDGQELGTHQGGYTPFEFELTDRLSFGSSNTLSIKVEDTYKDWHLYGKQGYGNARGIWQTAYLEARGQQYIGSLHFSPDIDNEKVRVDVTLDSAPAEGTQLALKFKNGEYPETTIPADGSELSFEIALPGQHLWSLDDPYLYEVSASVISGGKCVDEVSSYFGQRKVSAMTVPGKDYKYVALNNKPIYLQLCLDQSYHPEGFYTFPSDEFMKNEILLSKRLGLNGNRVHIKVELPRKLYWADRLGLLIMADVPNFWGEPGPQARQEWENCMRAQVERDYNHPSIFAWVDFNETWGLFTKEEGGKVYRPETQEWVRSMYLLTKQLDPTRLVEDNSACNLDHVQTDLNTWHSYRTGYDWERIVAEFDERTFPGSTYNYINGNSCDDAPMLNSECGNVWGYKGSAGDCDYTWDYHEMMNSFHRHPKVAGWLYTEHHDVINEWNGYVKFDRSAKVDGLDSFIPGMSVTDFHSYYYIVPEGSLCSDVPANSVQKVRLLASFMTDRDPGAMTLETTLSGVNSLGESMTCGTESSSVAFKAFDLVPAAERDVKIPEENGVYQLAYVLKDADGKVLHRNFSLFVVSDGRTPENVISFGPDSYTAKSWSIKSTEVLGGLKVNGFGEGCFEYSVAIPEGVNTDSAQLVFEASAKELFGKDIDKNDAIEGDFMLGAGTFDHCKSSNSYAMTDEVLHPSEVSISINGVDAGTYALADDPADHRGVLSWHSQPRERLMYEAGSYGYLIRADIPAGALKAGETAVIRLSAPKGGLAIYGRNFGRYPLDPSIVLR